MSCLNDATVQTHYESLSQARVDELSRSGARVIGWHETPPTALPHELWSGEQVRIAFLALIAARISHDANASSRDVARSVRAAAIVQRAGFSVPYWLEFRRIYPSFWRAALDRLTTPDVVEGFCCLTSEVDSVSLSPDK